MKRIAKPILAVLAFVALAAPASAQQQQRTYYDSSGRVVGRSSIDSSGAVTNRDASGRVISRETTSGNQTTVRDASGRVIGRRASGPQR